MVELIVYGSGHDPHSGGVAHQLSLQDVHVFLYDAAALPISTTSADDEPPVVSLNRWGTGEYENMSLAGRTIWWRNKYFDEKIATPGHQAHYFATTEKKAYFQGLLFRHRLRHFNDVNALLQATNKSFELYTAQKAGFRVPTYLITNDKADALQFTALRDRSVVKPLNESFVPPTLGNGNDYKWIWANEITADEIAAATDEEFAIAPMIIQELVDRRRELRHIQFGEEGVTYAVKREDVGDDVLDWRAPSQTVPIAEVDLGPDMRRLCARYLRLLGLTYGVFDFVEDKAGNIAFLECNPDGQWKGFENASGGTATCALFADGILRLLDDGHSVSRAS